MPSKTYNVICTVQCTARKYKLLHNYVHVHVPINVEHEMLRECVGHLPFSEEYMYLIKLPNLESKIQYGSFIRGKKLR